MNKKVIECKMCGVTSDTMYINPETRLCNACRVENAVIIIKIKEPEDIIRVHDTLKKIFGE